MYILLSAHGWYNSSNMQKYNYRIFPIKRPRGRYILQRGGRLIETNFWQNVVFNNCVIVNK